MNLMDLAQGRGNEPGRIVGNALYYLAENENGELILRLREPYSKDKEMQEIFSHLGETIEVLTHPCILTPTEYKEEEDGGYWLIKQNRLQSFASFLRNSPSKLADEGWKESIVNSLLSAVDVAHRRGLYFVDLNLQNILVTKGNRPEIRLLPPCSMFLDKKNDIWTVKKEHLAPELFTDLPIERQVDIYAIGQFIKKLYHYGQIPYEYRKACEVALKERVDHRFATVGEMQRYMESLHKRSTRSGYVKTFFLVTAIFGLFLWWLQDDGEEVREMRSEDIEMPSDTLEEDKLMEEVEKYLRDTTYLLPDTSITLSEEKKQEQRERMRKAEQAFEREFRKFARPIVRKIYDSELMRSGKQEYESVVAKYSLQLQELQERLARQYEIEFSTANNICNNVVQEIANQCMSGDNLEVDE